MKTLLLTRRSAFQYYCANTLHERGVLTEVVLEEGRSFPPQAFSLSAALRRARTESVGLAAHPLRAARRLLNKARLGEYYGSQERHNRRVLGRGYEALRPGLRSAVFGSVNEPAAVRHIRESGAALVFVFGTGIVRPQVFEGCGAVFVNMHWGWSPDYRGEGIVSALASEGPGALGVTVHLLDAGVDSGDILYRSRCQVDPEDNFYSIGLKLAKLGTERFCEAYKAFRRDGALRGSPQDKSRGRLYSGTYMREHPELYPRAWKALRGAAAPKVEARSPAEGGAA